MPPPANAGAINATPVVTTASAITVAIVFMAVTSDGDDKLSSDGSTRYKMLRVNKAD